MKQKRTPRAHRNQSQGFTLVEMVVALGVSSLLMLGLATMSVEFFRMGIKMDSDSAYQMLRQLTLLSVSPGGAGIVGQGDSCSQTLRNHTVTWSYNPSPTPTWSLAFDSNPIALQFAGQELVRGPTSPATLPTPPEQVYSGWVVSLMAVQNLKCLTLGATPTTCLTGTTAPSSPTEFTATLVMRAGRNIATPSAPPQREYKIPIRFVASAPVANVYTVTGCSVSNAAPGDPDRDFCDAACLDDYGLPLWPSGTCWDTTANRCFLTLNDCRAMGVSFDDAAGGTLGLSRPDNGFSNIQPIPIGAPSTWRCDMKQLKQNIFIPHGTNTGCANTSNMFLGAMAQDWTGGNYICQNSTTSAPCENCVRAAPLDINSPSQIACNPGVLGSVDDIKLQAWVEFGASSGGIPNPVGNTCGYVPVVSPPLNLCPNSCDTGGPL